jgi:PAS domain S-box-containing protein
MASAADASANAIAFTDTGGRIVYANPAFLEMWGYRGEAEVQGRQMEQFWEEGYRQACDAVQRELRWIGEMTGRRRDGTSFEAHLSAAGVTDGAGDLLGIVCSCVDITDRKGIEREMQFRNRLLSTLNEITQVSGLQHSLEGMLKVLLESALKTTGNTTGGVYLLDRSRRQATLYQQIGIPETVLHRYRTLAADDAAVISISNLVSPKYVSAGSETHPEESRLIDSLQVSRLACIPLLAGSETIGVLLVGGLTDRAFSQEEAELLKAIGRDVGTGILNRWLHQELEAAHREANLYLDIMTHDIKNAENVSNLYADLLIEVLDGEPELFAGKLKASIRKSIGILDTVSTIRKIHEESPRLAPVNLNRVAREEMVNHPEAKIRYHSTPALVQADSLLSEIFTNLLGNAAKFGGPGTEITVRIEEAGDEVLVSVEDTGPGVPDEKKRMIFNRFERGPYTERGEGLGLYICWMLVARYGGRIWVDDRVPGEPHKGAAFRFTLKKASPSGEDPESAHPITTS